MNTIEHLLLILQLKLQRSVDYHENILQIHGITYETGRYNILIKSIPLLILITKFFLFVPDIIHQTKKYMLVLEYADSVTLNNYLKNHFIELGWTDKFEFA